MKISIAVGLKGDISSHIEEQSSGLRSLGGGVSGAKSSFVGQCRDSKDMIVEEVT
jgi:hypothetical protein